MRIACINKNNVVENVIIAESNFFNEVGLNFLTYYTFIEIVTELETPETPMHIVTRDCCIGARFENGVFIRPEQESMMY